MDAHKLSMRRCLLVAAALVLAAGPAAAQGIKERMAQRLPVIEHLKSRGIVGENNQGYLEFVGGPREKEDVVAAENRDRQAVYAAIARKTGTTPELVGRRRAHQIAEQSRSGVMLQRPDGSWYTK